MLQLHDSSPFTSGIFSLPDVRGVDTLVVVIKASFEIGPPLRVAAEQQPLVLSDEYWGEPGASSLRYPSEVHPAKPGTDLLVLGEACSPGGQPQSQLELVVQVAGRDLRARVYGDRQWVKGVGGLQPGRPAPFVRLPLIYEHAYGGRDTPAATEEGVAIYAAELRNPVGRGFVGEAGARALLGQLAPNIDDPREPLSRAGQAPSPAGFGAIAPGWQPRLRYAGTYDARWRETRAPHLPADFDPRFLNCAREELIFSPPLEGGESVVLSGFHPCGVQHLTLPSCRFELIVTLAGAPIRAETVLDRVVLEPTDSRLGMSWRAVVPVDKRLLQVEKVELALLQLEGAVGP